MRFDVILIVLSSLISWTTAFAGDTKGNGGDFVVCDTGEAVRTVELLDYYESRNILHWSMTTTTATTPVARALELLDHLDAAAPEKANEYRQDVATFMDNATFIADSVLPDIHDSQHVFVGEGCKLMQAAIQRQPRTPSERRYTIAKDLWDRAAVIDQAGLILHEVIYKDLLNLGHADSKRTRYFNGLIASGPLTPARYAETVRLVGLDTVDEGHAAPVNFLDITSGFQFRYPVDFANGAQRTHVWRGVSDTERCDARVLAGNATSILPGMTFELGNHGMQQFGSEPQSVWFSLSGSTLKVKVECTVLADTWSDRLVRIANTFGNFISRPDISGTEGVATLRGAPTEPVVMTSGCATQLAIICFHKTMHGELCQRIADRTCDATPNLDPTCVEDHFDERLGYFYAHPEAQNGESATDIAFASAIQLCE